MKILRHLTRPGRLALGLTLLAGLFASPGLAEWKQYYADSNAQYFVDFDSAKKQPNGTVVCFEKQNIFNSALSNQLVRVYKLRGAPTTAITTMIYDCEARKAKADSVNFYNQRNEALGTVAPNDPSFRFVTPGTVGEAMIGAICQRVNAGARPDSRQALPEAAPAKPSGSGASTGSGFFVTASGLIVTNNHVIENRHQISLVAGKGSKLPLEVVATDKNNDLALLRSNVNVTEFFHLAGEKNIRQGEEVIVMGYPLQGYIAEDLNITNGIISALSGPGNDPRLLQITAPVQPGNSGGPLLDSCGNVLGVVSAKLNALSIAKATGDIPQNINFAINKAVVAAFLSANSAQSATEDCQSPLKPVDILERYKKAVVKIMAE